MIPEPKSQSQKSDGMSLPRGAFSLVELLVVMAVILIILAFTVPAFQSIGGSTNLTTGASIITDHLELARQTALTKNQVVEVRFYKIPAEGNPELAYRAIQLYSYSEPWRDASGKFVTDENQLAVAITKLQRLPLGIVISDEQKYSTLININSNTRPEKTGLVPGITDPVNYRYFRFGPSGSTDLNPNGAKADEWFLTVKPEMAPAESDRPASNFITAMLDPVSGRTRIYRP